MASPKPPATMFGPDALQRRARFDRQPIRPPATKYGSAPLQPKPDFRRQAIPSPSVKFGPAAVQAKTAARTSVSAPSRFGATAPSRPIVAQLKRVPPPAPIGRWLPRGTIQASEDIVLSQQTVSFQKESKKTNEKFQKKVQNGKLLVRYVEVENGFDISYGEFVRDKKFDFGDHVEQSLLEEYVNFAAGRRHLSNVSVYAYEIYLYTYLFPCLSCMSYVEAIGDEVMGVNTKALKKICGNLDEFCPTKLRLCADNPKLRLQATDTMWKNDPNPGYKISARKEVLAFHGWNVSTLSTSSMGISSTIIGYNPFDFEDEEF